MSSHGNQHASSSGTDEEYFKERELQGGVAGWVLPAGLGVAYVISGDFAGRNFGLAGLVGTTLEVSCHHHQSVRTHPGFVAVARADDGTLEAMELTGELTGERFCLAVQWHPEPSPDVGLLTGLVRAASSYSTRRDAESPG